MYITIIENINTIGMFVLLYILSNSVYYFQTRNRVTISPKINSSLEIYKELTYNNSAFYLLLAAPMVFFISEYISLITALIGILVNIKNRKSCPGIERQ